MTARQKCHAINGGMRRVFPKKYSTFFVIYILVNVSLYVLGTQCSPVESRLQVGPRALKKNLGNKG
jgi:hypothetical protein